MVLFTDYVTFIIIFQEKPRTKSRPETIEKLEADLKAGTENETLSCSTTTGSDYATGNEQTGNGDESSNSGTEKFPKKIRNAYVIIKTGSE